MYNPLTHKKPYGATAVGKQTSIEFPLDSSVGVKRVFVVLRKGETELRYELPLAEEKDGEQFFRGAFALNDSGIWHYRFEGELSDGDIAFFGRDLDGGAVRGDWLPEWQLTVSKTDYKTPDWSKHGVIYHIFADRFAKDGERPFLKDGTLHTDWYETPDVAEEGKDYRADDFFGGNAKGIISKLDYLNSLGVTCIYLSPVFLSYSNHRYDTADYLTIDDLFGDEKEFKDLIEKAASKGIKIILDGVFNHTGADSLYFNKFGRFNSVGAYQSQDSPYYDWYYFFDFPDNYHCWWGSTCVPTVNKSAEGFRKLILGNGGVIDKWTGLGVKGWRLDVVDELPIDFTTDLCGKIKNDDKNALIIGEVWEDASTKVSYGSWRPYFMGGQLDGVMNYPFKEAILSYAVDGDKAAFVENVQHILENYPKESLDCSMTLIGTHDTVRALTRLGCADAPETLKEQAAYKLPGKRRELAIGRLKLASLLQFTLPGVPCVYYGDEAGVEGFADPLNRATYPWGRENKELVAHYAALGKLRRDYKNLLTGETRFVGSGEELAFERVSSFGTLKVVVCHRKASVLVDGKTVFSI